MPSVELILVIVLAGLTWLWLDSLKVREAAVKAARAACEADGLLLLDDTVAIRALKTSRNDQGHVRIQRTYEFEFSDTGDNRRKGSIVMLGQRVVLFNVGVRTTAVAHHLHD
jgi:hypothetical protein